jgi:hypothetical protein
MSGPAIAPLDRALRLVKRLGIRPHDGRTAAVMRAIEYANQVRGWDIDEMRDDWNALVGLVERAEQNRKEKRDGAGS